MTQPPQYQPPSTSKPKMSRKRKATYWTGGVFAGLVVIGAIGDATGAGKQGTDAAHSQTIVAVDTASHAAASSPAVSKPASPAATPHTSAAAVKAATKPKPSPSPSCTLADNRDIYVWMKVPGVEDSAQELGEVDLANCTPAIDMVISTAPTGTGYCTQVGWVDQNPGYDANAEVAKPLKHVIEEVGGSC